jgi:hypothetical protein
MKTTSRIFNIIGLILTSIAIIFMLFVAFLSGLGGSEVILFLLFILLGISLPVVGLVMTKKGLKAAGLIMGILSFIIGIAGLVIISAALMMALAWH